MTNQEAIEIIKLTYPLKDIPSEFIQTNKAYSTIAEAYEKAFELLTDEEKRFVKELESIKTDIDKMLKSDEVAEDKFSNVIINKSYLFKSIINKHIAEIKGE